MQVRIDTSHAQSGVERIEKAARDIMRNSEKLLKKVRNTGRGMQTQMHDTVYKETKRIESDLENLHNEMRKLEAYMQMLSSYIAEYNRCGYPGSVCGPYHADVDTLDISAYLDSTRDVADRVNSVRCTADEDHARITNQIDSAIYRLDDNHAQCDGALSSLHDKIYSAEARLQECRAKLAALEEKKRDLENRIRAARERAETAYRNAAAVYIPPPQSWSDSDGTVHNNSAEIAAAISRKNGYLAEAARYEAEAARLQDELNGVVREIVEVCERINYLENLLSQMRITEAELQSHLRELEMSRGALYKCRGSLNSVHADCDSSCHEFNRQCADVAENLVRANSALNNYDDTVLSDPRIQGWRLF